MYYPLDDHYVFTDNFYTFIRQSTTTFADSPVGTIIMNAETVLTSTTNNENSRFPVSNARIVTDPFLEYLTTNATETIIQITFLNNIDTLFLGNVNFDDFTITANLIDSDLTTFSNPNTGRYNGVCFFNTTGINILTITIPGQAPNDGKSYFTIGVIMGGVRSVLQPRREAGRGLVEPIETIMFDRNNKEINNSGRTYHTVNINFKNIETADIITLRTLENEVGMDGVSLIYENYADRETGIIAERIGPFPDLEKSLGWYDNILSFKEKV